MNNAFNMTGAASQTAGQIDNVFIFILSIGIFFFLVTQGALIYFVIRYKKRKGDPDRETPYITESRTLERIWIIVPSILVLAIFYYGYVVFMKVKTPIQGASEVNVVASQWLWKFRYPDGRVVVNELRVPLGKPVQLTMTSTDVIHSFYVPDYRVNQDILPGRYTYLWFTPDKTGEFVVFCNQYCGVGHSEMLAKIIVMPQADYDRWLTGAPAAGGAPLAGRGEQLVKNSGCLACHSTDGTLKVGPTLKGLYGSSVALADGSAVLADDNYMKESLYEPGAKVVKGFPNVMPTFKGVLTDDDVTAVIAYIKTLGPAGHMEPDEKAETNAGTHR